MKTCSKCLVEKPLDDFYPRQRKCKKCCIQSQREWSLAHPEKVKGYFEKFKKEKLDQYKRSKRKYFEKNRKIISEKSNEWKKAHRDHWNKYVRSYKQKNPNYKISEILRTRMRTALNQNKKCDTTRNLLGCDYRYFREYLESKFQKGMTWGNYGYYGWHIDHIIPCAKFDLSDPDEQKKCFHYTNLQPLWATDNLHKYSH